MERTGRERERESLTRRRTLINERSESRQSSNKWSTHTCYTLPTASNPSSSSAFHPLKYLCGCINTSTPPYAHYRLALAQPSNNPSILHFKVMLPFFYILRLPFLLLPSRVRSGVVKHTWRRRFHCFPPSVSLLPAYCLAFAAFPCGPRFNTTAAEMKKKKRNL